MARLTTYSQSALENAVQEVQKGGALRKAASDWGVPRSTLQARLRGKGCSQSGHAFQQRLTRDQEAELAQWVRIQDGLGQGPTHAQIRDLAVRLNRANQSHEPLGKKWVQHFIGRNPSIKTLQSTPLDSTRINGASRDAINRFFDRLELSEIDVIDQSDRWNMDEVGILEGRGSNGLVLGQSEKKKILYYQSGSRTWTTIIECISANGKALDPLILFKGKEIQHQWFEKKLAHLSRWSFYCSPNGWTSNEIAIHWLHKVFLPNTIPEKSGARRLLILDGHESHQSIEFMWACFQAKVQLLILPPHTSHILQPLDVGIFSQLKRAYRGLLSDEPITTDYNAPIGKATFLKLYAQARQSGITPANIAGAWRGAGLWPIDREKILRSRFILQPNEPERLDQPNPASLNPFNESESDSDSSSDSDWLHTPRRSTEILEAAKQIFAIDFNEPIVRLLFEKVGKSIDVSAVKLATIEAERDKLANQVARIKPMRRAKVNADPNEVFVRIEDIMRTRAKWGNQLDPQRGSEEAQLVEFESLCLEWQLE